MVVEATGTHGTLQRTFHWSTRRGHDANKGVFAYKTWTFTAIDDMTTLIFQSEDKRIASNCGPVVAAMSLTPLGPG